MRLFYTASCGWLWIWFSPLFFFGKISLPLLMMISAMSYGLTSCYHSRTPSLYNRYRLAQSILIYSMHFFWYQLLEVLCQVCLGIDQAVSRSPPYYIWIVRLSAVSSATILSVCPPVWFHAVTLSALSINTGNCKSYLSDSVAITSSPALTLAPVLRSWL